MFVGTINKLEVVTVNGFDDLTEVATKTIDLTELREIYQQGIKSGASKEVMSEIVFDLFASIYSGS